MPFKSEAQRKWMYANHPDMAKEWESHTPKGEKLPKRKKRRRKRRSKSVVLALWASKVTYDCLMECGDNIEAGLAAALIGERPEFFKIIETFRRLAGRLAEFIIKVEEDINPLRIGFYRGLR